MAISVDRPAKGEKACISSAFLLSFSASRLHRNKPFTVAQKRLRAKRRQKREKSVQMDSMYPNVPSQWPQNVPDPQHVHVDSAPPSNDDWKDRSASNTNAGGSAAAQPSLDLSDFGLGDIPGKHSSRRPSTDLFHQSRTNLLTFPSNRAVDVHLNIIATAIVLCPSVSKLLYLYRPCPVQCHGIWFYDLAKFLSSITTFELFDTEWCNYVVAVAVLNVATASCVSTTPTTPSASTYDRVSGPTSGAGYD